VKSLWVIWVLSALSPSALDATLETSRGQRIHVADLWGKPTVIFYEDKDSVGENQVLKRALFDQGKSGALRPETATVFGIANLRGLNWFPARSFALAKVRSNENGWGIPIYIDWEGSLSKSPWGLKSRGSTVLLIAPDGALLFSKTGPLSAQEVSGFLALLEQQIHP
jgi:predicted transcriptional regulator